jgi:hypothetical protein
MEDRRQSREHGVSLLLHGRQITANAAKGADPRRRAKGARDFLLHFGPAQVPLGLVVRKRNREVVEQRQHLLGTRKQRIQEILGRALLGPTFGRSCRRGGWGWLSGIARRQNLEIAGHPVVTLDGGNGAQVEPPPLVAGVMQSEQEIVHLAGPRLPLLLGDSGTIAQQVGTTDAVRTGIAIIADKAVVHASPGKAWPDADLVHGLPASRGMPGQMGQEAGAVHMQPMQHPIDADARFISMLEAAGRQQLRNALDRRGQPLGGQFAPLQQGGFGDLAATERLQCFAGARRGQQLLLVQIHRQRLQVRAVLDGRADRGGKAAQAGGVTARATDHFDLMLVGQQADFREVEDLPTFGDAACNRPEVLTALAADLGTVAHQLIWLLRQRKRMSRMSRLTSWRFRAGTTRRAWQTRQPIRGGRLTAGATVFGQALFQFLDASVRLGQLLLQWQQLRHQRFEQAIFFSQGLQFVFLRHTGTLTGFLSFRKSVGALSSYDIKKAGTKTAAPYIAISVHYLVYETHFVLALGSIASVLLAYLSPFNAIHRLVPFPLMLLSYPGFRSLIALLN